MPDSSEHALTIRADVRELHAFGMAASPFTPAAVAGAIAVAVLGIPGTPPSVAAMGPPGVVQENAGQ